MRRRLLGIGFALLLSCASDHEAPPRTPSPPVLSAVPLRDPAPAESEPPTSSNRTVTHEPREPQRTQRSERACRSEKDLPNCHAAALDHYYRRTEGDDASALALFGDACEAGYSASCNGVGTMMAEGRGTSADLSAAARFYHRACAGDGSTGCEHLAIAYEQGLGVPQDVTTAKAVRARGRCLFEQSLTKAPAYAKCSPLAPFR